MPHFLDYLGVGLVDGILADLGVSSHHFDSAGRGFSFRFDGPLDMRMSQGMKMTAADVVATYSADELARIFGAYGELDKPYKLATTIIAKRSQKAISTTSQLKQVVEAVAPRTELAKTLTKVFQALRIEVNHEMDALSEMLSSCADVLAVGGRLSVIAYHSLEDRMVKNLMRSGDIGKAEAEADAIYGQSSVPFKALNRKPIVPSAQEVEANPRSRSAKLRVAQRIKN